MPCVTSVPDAALHIRDGERLRVDGTRGTVVRLDVAEPRRRSSMPAASARVEAS
jgi:hypothetical protein